MPKRPLLIGYYERLVALEPDRETWQYLKEILNWDDFVGGKKS